MIKKNIPLFFRKIIAHIFKVCQNLKINKINNNNKMDIFKVYLNFKINKINDNNKKISKKTRKLNKNIIFFK